ncbi:MAG: HAD family hydrolase [Dehalococcoidia bacterium]
MSATVAVKAALFDLDGTLVDSLPTIADAMAEAARMHGLDGNAEEIIPLIGAPMHILVEELYGVSREVANAVNEDYLRVYHSTYILATPPHPGASELLDTLAEAGVRLAIVTNKRDEGARLMAHLMGWLDRFEVIHGRDSGAPKPEPEAAHAVLRKMGVAPSEAAFVGDTEFDMNCGRDAGLAAVIGVVGSRDEERLRAEGATHIVRSLHEIAPLLAGAQVHG